MKRLILAVLGLSTLACASGGEEETELVVAVRTAVVVRGPIAETATAAGSVVAKQEAVVSAPQGGQLAPVPLLQGQRVRAGDVLASLESADLADADRARRQAGAQVAALEHLAERRRALLEQGGISKKDVDGTELDLANARADLAAAQRSVAAMTLRAPFDGVVIEQLQTAGGWVAEGTPVARIADLSSLRAVARFSDAVGPRIAVGATATVLDDAIRGEPVPGVVAAVSPGTDPLRRTTEVWVDLEEAGDRLRVGDGARVTAVVASADDALLVPRAAVELASPTGDEGTVMVAGADGLAHEARVRVGLRTADQFEVVSGLAGGEAVIVEGNYALPDGTKVEVAPPEGAADAG